MDMYVGKSNGVLPAARRHFHPNWEIVIPVWGGGFFESTRESFFFSAGCVYIVPPFTEHWIRSDDGFTDIYIQTDFLRLSPNKVTVLHGMEQMAALGELLYSAYSRRDMGHRGSMECAFSLIVQLLYEHLESDPDSPAFRTRDFLVDHLGDSWVSMKTLSERLGYNGDYIRRFFKEEFQITPMEYLDRLRVTKAKELLQNMPAYQLKEVAELCGFSDPFYFSRFFKKHVGCSPMDFKKQAFRPLSSPKDPDA